MVCRESTGYRDSREGGVLLAVIQWVFSKSNVIKLGKQHLMHTLSFEMLLPWKKSSFMWLWFSPEMSSREKWEIEMHILAGNCVNSNEWVVQSQQISTTGFLPVCFFTNSSSGWGQALLLVAVWGLNCFLDGQMFLCNMLHDKIFCVPYFSTGSKRKQFLLFYYFMQIISYSKKNIKHYLGCYW